MLIVPELKLIFIRPKKVAGTSLQNALLSYLGYVSEEDQVRYRAQVYKEMFVEAPYRKYKEYLDNLDSLSVMQIRRCLLTHIVHISAEKGKRMVSEYTWNNYLKISTVRCPYDMAISDYYWRHKNRARKDLYAFLLRTKCYLENYRIPCIENRLAVDFIIRYENIEEDIQKLERKLGIPEGQILERFKRASDHVNIRPSGQDVRTVYYKYPMAQVAIDKCMNANMDNELIARYYPAYKKRVLQQFPLGYFTKIMLKEGFTTLIYRIKWRLKRLIRKLILYTPHK